MSQRPFEPIHSDRAPAAIGPYSQAVRAGELVFLSGQIALVPDTMELAGDDVATQTRQVFANLSAVAEAAGGSLEHLVKLNVYLTDLGNFQIVNEIMTELFREPYPVRAALGVSALPRGAQVEVEAVMVAPRGA